MKLPDGMVTIVIPILLVVSGNFDFPALQAAKAKIKADISNQKQTIMDLDVGMKDLQIKNA